MSHLELARVRLPVLLAAAALLCFVRLGDAPITYASEKRCFEVARHMVETGDWLVPVMDGQPRLQKPPLYYWMVSSTAVARGLLSRAELRLPAALCGIAVVAIVVAWGASLRGPSCGLLAGALLLASVQFATLARRGVAEMPLALGTTLALWSFDRAFFGRSRAAVPLFFAALSIALLAKATAGLLVVAIPVCAALLAARSLGRAMRPGYLILLAITLLASVAWYGVVLVKVPGAYETLRSEMLRPVVGEAHRRPPWFYVPQFFAAGFPLSLLLPFVVWRGLRSRFWADVPRARFVAVAWMALYVVLSLIPGKQRHYLLPLWPLYATSVAESLLALAQETPQRFLPWARRLCGSLGALGVLVAVPAGLHLIVVGTPLWQTVCLALAIATGGCLAIVEARRQRWGTAVAAGVSALVVALLVYHASFQVWRQQFDEAVVEQRPDFDAARWRALFSRWPLLREVYLARDGPARAGDAAGALGQPTPAPDGVSAR